MIKLVNLEFCVSNPEKGKTLRLSLSELFGIDKEAAVKLRMGYSDGSTSVFEIPTICDVALADGRGSLRIFPASCYGRFLDIDLTSGRDGKEKLGKERKK